MAFYLRIVTLCVEISIYGFNFLRNKSIFLLVFTLFEFHFQSEIFSLNIYSLFWEFPKDFLRYCKMECKPSSLKQYFEEHVHFLLFDRMNMALFRLNKYLRNVKNRFFWIFFDEGNFTWKIKTKCSKHTVPFCEMILWIFNWKLHDDLPLKF